MTAIHIYDLNDADDVADYTNAIHATEAIVALDQVREMLRRYWKYADPAKQDVGQVVDEIYERFFVIAGAVLEATE